MHRNLARVVVCILALVGTLPALAQGEIPIFASAGTVIVADGTYIVTADIVGTGLAPVIDVAAPNVDIDLNGFNLTQPGAFPVIAVTAAAVTHLTIRNGSLNSGTFGINAPVSGEKIVIEDVKIQGSGTTGIHVGGIQSTAIRRVMIQDIGAGRGILIDGPGLETAVIEDTVIRGVDGSGITFISGSVTIRNNQIFGAGSFLAPSAGIAVTDGTGSLVSENTIAFSKNEGITLSGTSTGNKLFDNVVYGSQSHGIHLGTFTEDTLVFDNAGTGNGFGLPGGHGLFVEGDGNHIDRNTLNRNSGYGLSFSGSATSNTFGRNTARFNGGPVAAACAPLFPPQSCDEGGSNTTFGDNLIPGPPIF